MSELRPRSTARSIKSAGIARHGRLKKSGPWGTVLSFIGAAMVVVLVSGSAVGAIVFNQLNNQIKTVTLIGETEGPPPSIGAYPDGFNMLIVGSDMCESKNCGVRGSANLNDVTMLLHVSADGTNATAVSFPRDLVVPIPSCPKEDGSGNNAAMSAMPINNTLFYGGLACTVLTVENLTGLDIQFAGLITFKGVIKMSNAVGGVEVCVAGDIDDPYVGLHLKKGKHTLKGQKALAFLRSRHGVGDGSDLSRISSQQLYLASLMRTVRGDGTLTDLPRLYSLANAAANNIHLSTSLAHTDTMVSMALALADIDLDRLVFVQYPGSTEDPDFPGRVVPIRDLADTMFAKIAADEPCSLSPAPATGDPLVVGPPVAPAEVPAGGEAGDPETEVPPSPTPPSATPTPTPAPERLEGLTGRTAADDSCAQVKRG